MHVPFKKRFLVSAISGSVLALSFATSVYAQEAGKSEKEETSAETKTADEVVIVGTRKALENANDVKRSAETVVDSVTATDVGALPDKSIAEALQRVAGVTVSRFAATGDTQHFSAEPSGVIIRGLDQVRSEFNGRDTFSADSSRGLSWEDISPELMQRIDVYKNQTADLIEGGISGLIDLHTRVPFDFDGQLISGSAEVNYSDVADSYNPNVSGLYSNTWHTDAGEFGVLGQIATSRLNTRSQGMYLGRMGLYAPGSFEVPTEAGQPKQYTTEETYVPTFITARDNLYERERTGGAFAAQWKSLDETMLATFQFNRSEYDQVNTEYSALNWVFALWGRKANFVIDPGWVDGAAPPPGQYFTFNKDRSFQSGELTSGLGWQGASVAEAAAFGANNEGIPLVNPNSCGWGTSPEYTTQYCDAPYDRKGVGMETNSRRITEQSMTQDASINFKWTPNDKFSAKFDLQKVDADKQSYGSAGALQSYTGMHADFSGDLPVVGYSEPTNVNFSEGGLNNPNSWSYAWIQDTKGNSNGKSLALKADGEYKFDLKWIDSLRFGVRTVEREQLVREAWNFRGITSRWESAAYYNVDKTSPIAHVKNQGQDTFFAGYPTPDKTLESRAFPSDYMGGGVMDTTKLFYLKPEMLGNPALVNQYFDRSILGIGQFDPICSATGSVRGNEIIDDKGKSTCFTPGETLKVKEGSDAAYVMLKFGGKDATLFGSDIPVSGNIGVRYVETSTKSYGSTSFGKFTAEQLKCFKYTAPSVVDPTQPYVPPSTPYSPGCYVVGAEAHNKLVPDMPAMVDDGNGTMIENPEKFYLPSEVVGSRDDLAFHNGAITPVIGEKTYQNILPSLNLKFDLTEKALVRLAYSKGMTRPDFSLYRYAAQINEPGIDVSYTSLCKNFNTKTNTVDPVPNCTPNPEVTVNGAGEVIAARPRYQVGTGNPFIKPITADNYDATFEYYFSGAGLVSVNLFQKDFHDYITYGTTIKKVTNNGVTRDLYMNGPVNGDGASVKGFEINTQKFLDFLPAPYDGIGFQANYTKIFNEGIKNTNYDSGSGGAVSDRDFYVKTDALQGMSEDAYNFTLMYEKGPFAFRTAYNWRSKYLVTANDCCNLPVWQGDQGFLDASVRYRIGDGMEVSLQASNLLDTTTKLYQQVHSSDADVEPNKIVPTAWFKSDRRLSLGIRMKY